MRYIQFCLFFLIAGLLSFYAFANFKDINWQHAHGVWDKGKDFLLVLGVYYFINFSQKLKEEFIPILSVLLARLLWEIISWIFNISINNVVWINYLFILAVLSCLPILLKELYKTWKRK